MSRRGNDCHLLPFTLVAERVVGPVAVVAVFADFCVLDVDF